VSVEDAVPEIFEEIAVILLGTGLGDDVDHAAGVLAVLRLVVAGLHAELLQRVGERERGVDVGVLVDVVAAIKQIVGLIGARSVRCNQDVDRECLRITLVDSIDVRRDVNPCGECGELRRVAPVKRQLVDSGAFDHLRERAGGGVDLRRLCGHRHRGGGYADLE